MLSGDPSCRGVLASAGLLPRAALSGCTAREGSLEHGAAPVGRGYWMRGLGCCWWRGCRAPY